MISDQEVRALAFLAARCRPHHSPHAEWDEAGIAANIRKVAGMSLAEVTLAVIRAASNPQAASPGVIPVLTGEHWRERQPEPKAATTRPPRDAEACRQHGGWAGNCGGCKADELAAQAEQQQPATTRQDLPTPEQVAGYLAEYRRSNP